MVSVRFGAREYVENYLVWYERRIAHWKKYKSSMAKRESRYQELPKKRKMVKMLEEKKRKKENKNDAVNPRFFLREKLFQMYLFFLSKS